MKFEFKFVPTLCLCIVLVTPVLDSKEAMDNPHTHKEAPSLRIDAPAQKVATVTAGLVLLPRGIVIAEELAGSEFRITQ